MNQAALLSSQPQAIGAHSQLTQQFQLPQQIQPTQQQPLQLVQHKSKTKEKHPSPSTKEKPVTAQNESAFSFASNSQDSTALIKAEEDLANKINKI